MLPSHAVKFTSAISRQVIVSSRNAVTQHLQNENTNQKARPFKQLPGPSKLSSIAGFLPGGRYNGKSLSELNVLLREEYGDIFLMPGLFGKRDVLFTCNPNDMQTVYRTEGLQPKRRGLDVFDHYRKVLRPNIFKHAGGLISEQDDGWAHFRSTVNPVMMNPKSVLLYAPKMNKVVNEFIARIIAIRDPQTNEVPADFEKEINHWTIDTVGLVALDTELGMIKNSNANPVVQKFIDGTHEFFELLFLLDFQPSIWKYIPTPQFRRFVNMLDGLTDISLKYIDDALKRLQDQKHRGIPSKPEHEKSVLERLLNIDQTVATVMSMDMLLAGVDTTTSAMAGCLVSLATNPEKQQKLRTEIMQILPNKTDELTSDKLKTLPYLRACIKESMRLYPITTGTFRSTGQDVVLSGYRIPKDTDVAMLGELLLRDPKYYERPTEYLPERWLRVAEADGCPLNNTKIPFVFLPFGFGPRNCIGKRIVDLELEVALAKLVRNFEIHFNHPTDNFFKTILINTPNKPLQFQFNDLKY